MIAYSGGVDSGFLARVAHEVLGGRALAVIADSPSLPTADKPQLACLSSRIPTGEAVTPEKLMQIEQAEDRLRDLGFREVRVRHHELRAGALARIEVGTDELPRLVDPEMAARVAAQLRSAGYTQVTVDLLGYRRGSTNGVSAAPIAFRTAPPIDAL